MSELEDLVKRQAAVWVDAPYYGNAERWTHLFWGEGSVFRRMFESLDCSHLVELACGHGRHSEYVVTKLDDKLGLFIGLDILSQNVDFCRQRLATFPKVTFALNSGTGFRPVWSSWASGIFCYDAMVHFDQNVVATYLADATRVLVPGGRALLHHSNYRKNPSSVFSQNPHARAYMSATLFKNLAEQASLKVLEQIPIRWGNEQDLDCITLVEKPLPLRPLEGPMIFEVTSKGKVDVLASIKAEAGQRTFVSSKEKSHINYMICILPRTGSTMFCSVLEGTNQLGCPDEYLNPRGVVQLYARQYVPSGVYEYFDILRRERSTPNGVFGLKVTFDDLKPILDAVLVKQLLSPIRFIYLEREDLVLQAVSAVVAQQSGVWHRDADGKPFRSQEIRQPEFDEPAIISKIDEYTRMRSNWERFFAIHSIDPLRLTYEQVLSDIGGATRLLAAEVGVSIDTPIDMTMAKTSKLANERSLEWAERVRSKYRARIQ